MHFTFTPPASNSRTVAILRALFGWVLMIPIFFFLVFMYLWAFILSVYGFFSLIISGKYPSSVFNYFVGLMRYSIRLQSFFYGLNDSLPSFSFEKVEEDIFTLDIDRHENYSRLQTLIIALFGVIIIFAQLFWLSIRQTIAGIGSFVAFWIVLFTGKFPEFVSEWIERSFRYEIELDRYLFSMDQKYPGNKILIVVSIILFVLYGIMNVNQIQETKKQFDQINSGTYPSTVLN